MKDKWRRKIRYIKKQGIYNSIIFGDDAFDECMPCVWYNGKGANECTNKRCRYRPMKFRKVTLKKIEKYRKEYAREVKDVGLNNDTDS